MWLEVGGGRESTKVTSSKNGKPPNEILKYQGAQVISGCHFFFEKNHFGTDMSFAQWMVAGRFVDRVSIITPDVLVLFLRAIGMRWPWKPWRHLIKSQELSLEIPDFWNGNYSQARFTKQYVTCAWCPLAFLREPGIISLEEGGKQLQGSNSVQTVQVATGLVDDLFPTILKFSCCDKERYIMICFQQS